MSNTICKNIYLVGLCIFLLGCSTAKMPNMIYSGKVFQGGFNKTPVYVHVTIDQSSVFFKRYCRSYITAECRKWTLSASFTASIYQSVLESALAEHGAVLVDAPNKATLVVDTNIKSTTGTNYLVLVTYDMLHTFYYMLVPFRYKKFFHQITSISDEVVIKKNGVQIIRFDVPVIHHTDFSFPDRLRFTIHDTSNTNIAQVTSIYKNEQESAIALILKKMKDNGLL